MIEIVEKLIPLVEGATTGAIWLIVGYFILTFMLAVVPTVAAVYGIYKLPSIVSSFKGTQEIHAIKFSKYGRMGCRIEERDLEKLLSAVADSDGYIWASDLNRAIQKLKE